MLRLFLSIVAAWWPCGWRWRGGGGRRRRWWQGRWRGWRCELNSTLVLVCIMFPFFRPFPWSHASCFRSFAPSLDLMTHATTSMCMLFASHPKCYRKRGKRLVALWCYMLASGSLLHGLQASQPCLVVFLIGVYVPTRFFRAARNFCSTLWILSFGCLCFQVPREYGGLAILSLPQTLYIAYSIMLLLPIVRLGWRHIKAHSSPICRQQKWRNFFKTMKMLSVVSIYKKMVVSRILLSPFL